jgi:chromate transporter
MPDSQEKMAARSMLTTKSLSLNIFLSFLKLGLTAFGGPAMIAHIKEMSVNCYRWLNEEAFRDGIVLCQSVPGATAMQTAAYVGFRANGIPGALASFIGFGLPAFLLMLLLSALYEGWNEIPRVAALFAGLQIIVVAIVANAAYYFGISIVKDIRTALIAAGAYLALFYGLSPFSSIIVAGFSGILLFRGTGIMTPAVVRKRDTQYLKQLVLLLSLIMAGIAVLYVLNRDLLVLALLMAKIDLFAFGGGFASLPLMLHEVVNVHGWMNNKTFMDGIALGQITPGPIVITAAFVGFLTHGVAGSVVSTLAIFTPSFLLVVIMVPYYDRLKASSLFIRASKGILSSFVGLLLYVTQNFTLAVSWNGFRLLLLIAVMIALYKKVNILYVVPVAAAISLMIF